MSKIIEYLKQQDAAANVIAASLFTAVFAGAWDVWWHGFLGRESFWSPPHLLLYMAVIVAILTGLYSWRIHKRGVWKWLGIVLILVPLSAPFDELWHRIFGVEELTSVLILWSPPHVILILSILTAFILILSVLGKDTNQNKGRFFSILSFAGIFSLLSILVQPLEPIGPWHLFGFWGAGVMSFVVVVVLFSARRYLSGFGRTTLTAFVITSLTSIGFSEATSAGAVEFLPHAHAPGWLVILSIIIPAVFLDIIHNPKLWSAGFAGLISGGILYGFATLFIESEFQYGSSGIAIILIASLLGGLLAGLISKHFVDK